MSLSLDPSYFKAIEPLIPVLSGPKPAVGDIASRRMGNAALFELNAGAAPRPSDVERSVYHARTADGFDVPVHRFTKTGTAASSALVPAIVYIHGGGIISLNVDDYAAVIEKQVSLSGVQFFGIDYRLAPENQFPIPMEDCFTGLQWVYEHVQDFGIDLTRVAIMGDSGGGNLAAAVALLARDRVLSPPLAKQILIYPMLDDRNQTSDAALEPFVTWNIDDNKTGWEAYLGSKAGGDDVSPYAAPARVDSVKGLPPTYIDVGQLDIFRDEDIEYARRLIAANIPTELHVYPGVPHAFEILAPATSITIQALENRVRAMLSF